MNSAFDALARYVSHQRLYRQESLVNQECKRVKPLEKRQRHRRQATRLNKVCPSIDLCSLFLTLIHTAIVCGYPSDIAEVPAEQRLHSFEYSTIRRGCKVGRSSLHVCQFLLPCYDTARVLIL